MPGATDATDAVRRFAGTLEAPPSPLRSNERRVRLPKAASTERRTGNRYAFALTLRYTVFHPDRQPKAGDGLTMDLSGAGVRFMAAGPLEPGCRIELSIGWPLLLDGGVPLQLRIYGTIVWSRETDTAIRIRRHEFRTRGAGTEAAAAAEARA